MALPRPLEGVRVVDFTWVRAGPWAARWLGSFGAEVIKVEWPQNMDMLRQNRFTVPEGVEPGPNSTGQFADTNANKRGITVNVRTPRGLELVKELISVSDVVIENFSSRIMQNWGLGYDELRKLRPDIVYVSMAGFGHVGRHHHYGTMGPAAQALSGLTFLSGLPGEPPAGWGWSYLDDTGGMYGAMCALTALYHRRTTGKGQHVDLSQMINRHHPYRLGLPGPHRQRPEGQTGRLPAGQPQCLARRTAGEQLPGPHRGPAQLLPHQGGRLQRLVRDYLRRRP